MPGKTGSTKSTLSWHHQLNYSIIDIINNEKSIKNRLKNSMKLKNGKPKNSVGKTRSSSWAWEKEKSFLYDKIHWLKVYEIKSKESLLMNKNAVNLETKRSWCFDWNFIHLKASIVNIYIKYIIFKHLCQFWRRRQIKGYVLEKLKYNLSN